MLTQQLAAVLDACKGSGLPEDFVARWAPDSHANRAQSVAQPANIETQKLIPNSRERVDLSIDTGDGLYWIEVKVGADLQPNQLFNYEAGLRSEPHDLKSLVFLTPSWYLPDQSQIPDSVATITWQEVGEWMNARCAEVPDRVEAWLLEGFVERLKEMRLFMEGSLSEDDIKVIERFGDAQLRLEALLNEVEHGVAERVVSMNSGASGDIGPSADHDRKRRRTKWPEYWVHYGYVDPEKIGCAAWFEWNLRRPDPEADGVTDDSGYRFGAGLTLEAATDDQVHQAIRTRLKQNLDVNPLGGWLRAFSYLPVAELANEGSQQNQVRRAVDHIVQAFEFASEALN